MNDINEKISALYDGELDRSEIDSLIESSCNDSLSQEKLSLYGLITYAVNSESHEPVAINSNQNLKKNIFSNIWLSNTLTAAASVLLTLTIVNNSDFSRLDISTSSSDQISSAINSKEAKEVAIKSEENLTDYVMKVVNDPNFMNSNQPIDLRNVGFSINSPQRYVYSKGKENFKIRIEKNNFGLNKIRYWKHGKKMIYLVPIADNRVVTIYGNIPAKTAISIAKSIN
tara:strand:+ start:678 stop:1361 length:684 start_codon:yes stop_codon:yes gene_type:complete